MRGCSYIHGPCVDGTKAGARCGDTVTGIDSQGAPRCTRHRSALRALPCGALVHEHDMTPCPDPYCRGCRGHDGEVLDPPREDADA